MLTLSHGEIGPLSACFPCGAAGRERRGAGDGRRARARGRRGGHSERVERGGEEEGGDTARGKEAGAGRACLAGSG